MSVKSQTSSLSTNKHSNSAKNFTNFKILDLNDF